MHIEHMHKMIEKLSECADSEISKGIKNVNTEEMGAVTDMLKDLNEAAYYATITKAMKEAKEEEEDDEKAELRRMKEMMHGGEMDERDYPRRMGYDRWRYSDGRFAPRGRGHRTRMGYMPPMMPDYPYMDDDYMMDDAYMRMGYSGGSRSGNYGGNSGRSGGNTGNSGSYGYEGSRGGESSGRMGNYGGRSGYGDGEGSKYGRSYDRYRDARRHYTESKDSEEKKRMEESMKEHVEDFSESIKEMWKDAEPQLRQQMKSEMMKIVQQLN